MVPVEPIRTGETEAKIVADLGDYIVTRKFSRDRLHQDQCPALSGEACNCTPVYGDTRSTLTVASKDGAKFPSPQAMLDKILGRLTFDPLAFAHDDPKRQLETLRKLVGIDTTEIEKLRRQAYDNRAGLKRLLDAKLHEVSKMPSYDEAPAEEQSLDAIRSRIEESKQAENRRLFAEQQKNDLSMVAERIKFDIHDVDIQLTSIEVKIAALQAEHANLTKARLAKVDAQIEAEQHLTQAIRDEREAREALIPFEDLTNELTRVHAINEQVRANGRRREALDQVNRIEMEIEAYTRDVNEADEAKRVMLESANFPVPGLGLNDDGVTFNGVPLAQASSSEQLRVSVAIGLALNPTLKVILIRNGNLLDEDNLKIIASQAEAADAQIWMEYVTSDAKAVQVMIADGSVAEA